MSLFFLLSYAVASLYLDVLQPYPFEPVKAKLVRIIALPTIALIHWSELSRTWLAIVGLYGTSYVVSSIASVRPLISWLGSTSEAGGPLTEGALVLIGLLIASYKQNILLMLRTVTLLSVPLCLYAIGQRFGFDPLTWDGSPAGPISRVYSTLGNPDQLGSLLVMLIPAALTLRYWPVVGLQLAALALTGDRTAWVAAGLTYAALHLFCWHKPSSRVIGVSGVVFVLCLTPLLIAIRPQSFAAKIGAVESVLPYVAVHPLIGMGPDTEETTVVPSHLWVAADGPSTQIDRSHDSVVDVLYERGAFGLVTTLFVVVYVAGIALRWRGDVGVLTLTLMLVAHTIDGFGAIEPLAARLLAWGCVGCILSYHGVRLSRLQTGETDAANHK